MTNKVQGYVNAIYSMAAAEGETSIVKTELQEVANSIESNSDLQQALTNPSVPSASRTQILNELLEGKVSKSTKTAVAMIVTADRSSDIVEIANQFASKSGDSSDFKVATVRSAVALSSDQLNRLAAALAKSLSCNVEINNIVDPDVIGGVVTTVDDQVIDGSIKTKIRKMKDAV